MKIEYSNSFLDFVSSTATLSSKVLFTKTEDGTASIGMKGNNGAYKITAKQGGFDFVGEKIAFQNFPEFRSIIKMFSDAQLDQNDNMISVSAGKSKINYLLSDPEVISQENIFNKFVNEPKTIGSMLLKKEDFEWIKKFSNILGSESIKFEASAEKVLVSIVHKSFSNSAEREFEIETFSGEDVLLYDISKDVFCNLPSADYTLNFMVTETKNGQKPVFGFNITNDELTFNFYIASK